MNLVVYMGRLTADPELKYVGKDNTPVCKFTIAVDRAYQKKGEEKKTDFFNCVAWSHLAEVITKNVGKGQRILIRGNNQNKTWDDADGKKRYATDMYVESMEFADSKRDSQGSTNTNTNISNEMPPGFSESDIPGEDDLPF